MLAKTPSPAEAQHLKSPPKTPQPRASSRSGYTSTARPHSSGVQDTDHDMEAGAGFDDGNDDDSDMDADPDRPAKGHRKDTRIDSDDDEVEEQPFRLVIRPSQADREQLFKMTESQKLHAQKAGDKAAGREKREANQIDEEVGKEKGEASMPKKGEKRITMMCARDLMLIFPYLDLDDCADQIVVAEENRTNANVVCSTLGREQRNTQWIVLLLYRGTSKSNSQLIIELKQYKFCS